MHKGGIAVLKGNLAPLGSVIKESAVEPDLLVYKGTAKCYDSEEAAIAAIIGGEIKEGHVVVIRYEGPKGGPGMREMLNPTAVITGMGLKVALLTDGRFSGASVAPASAISRRKPWKAAPWPGTRRGYYLHRYSQS